MGRASGFLSRELITTQISLRSGLFVPGFAPTHTPRDGSLNRKVARTNGARATQQDLLSPQLSGNGRDQGVARTRSAWRPMPPSASRSTWPASAVAAESGPRRPRYAPRVSAGAAGGSPWAPWPCGAARFPSSAQSPQPPYGGSLRVAVASNRQDAWQREPYSLSSPSSPSQSTKAAMIRSVRSSMSASVKSPRREISTSSRTAVPGTSVPLSFV